MRRSPFLVAAALLALSGTITITTPALADDGPHGAAHALSARTTLLDKPLVTIDPLPKITYPAGGEKSLAEVGPDTAGLLSAKALHVSSQGRDRSLTARAAIAEAVVKDILRAKVVASECRTEGQDVVGSSSVAELTVLGRNIDITTAPNTTIDVLGVATVKLNEQIRQGRTLTVNAVHVTVAGPVGRLTSADIVLSQVTCSASGPITVPSTPTATSSTPAITTSSTPATTTTAPSTGTEQSSTPATTPAGTTSNVLGVRPASNDSDLAQTGATGVLAMTLAALALLGGGVLAILFARRRRNAAPRSSD